MRARGRGSGNEISAAHHCARRVAGQDRAKPAITLSEEQITAIEASVRARLKDSDLAKFSGIVAKSIGGPILAVSGYVNAKNSSGGYIGDLAFDGFLLNNVGWSFRVLVIDDPSSIPAQRTCREWGLF